MKKFYNFIFFTLVAIISGNATAAQPDGKGKDESTVENYFAPTTNVETRADMGYTTDGTEILPRDHQIFITGETGTVYLDTANDVKVNGQSIVQQVGKGKNKIAFVNDLENYIGETIVVVKGKNKERPVDIYNADAETTIEYELPGAGNDCVPGERNVKAYMSPETVIPGAGSLEKVNSNMFMQGSGEFYQGFDSVEGCLPVGTPFGVEAYRSIQDLNTNATEYLDTDMNNTTVPGGFDIVGIRDIYTGAEVLDEDLDGVLDGTIAIDCDAPFPQEYEIIIAPAGGAYSASVINGVNGYNIVPPTGIIYDADCQDGTIDGKIVNPGVSVSNGQEQKNLTTPFIVFDYN